MMMHYEKPDILRVDNLSEGVYLASGGLPVCGSAYMGGHYHIPNPNDASNVMAFRGCDGCSAQDGDKCKIEVGAYDQLNPNGIFMPTWEQQNKLPTDKPY